MKFIENQNNWTIFSKKLTGDKQYHHNWVVVQQHSPLLFQVLLALGFIIGCAVSLVSYLTTAPVLNLI
jgi:hypothetical protein